MPSPFPGMDPYLENPAVWRDFHGQFIYACRKHLLSVLPTTYDAAVEEQVRLVERPPQARTLTKKDVLPDVTVVHGGSRRNVVAPGGGVAMATAEVVRLEPVVIAVPTYEEETYRRIEIIHRPERTLVTVIEVLSPTNKDGDAGSGEYRTKRSALRRQGVNVVEIDLLVGGQRTERSPQLPPTDYCAVVSRASTPTERQVYQWRLRQPLPGVEIPLRRGDPDVLLDLAAAFRGAYDDGGYAGRLPYDAAPIAPLSPEDTAWAAGVAKAALTDAATQETQS